jgi:hypothetical protein
LLTAALLTAALLTAALLTAALLTAALLTAALLTAALLTAALLTAAFETGLTEAGLTLKSSLAMLAFLVVFRVLIKLFFWMLISNFPLVDKFCRLRRQVLKHGKGQILPPGCHGTVG